jgi:hypothetical protein
VDRGRGAMDCGGTLPELGLTGRLTGRCNRPPAAAADRPFRYTDSPAAVDLLRPRAIHGSLKLEGRFRKGELMHRITPPATNVSSNFQPPFVARITSGWSRPPSSAAQPPIRYTDTSAREF